MLRKKAGLYGSEHPERPFQTIPAPPNGAESPIGADPYNPAFFEASVLTLRPRCLASERSIRARA
jgi:hypothetical protein